MLLWLFFHKIIRKAKKLNVANHNVDWKSKVKQLHRVLPLFRYGFCKQVRKAKEVYENKQKFKFAIFYITSGIKAENYGTAFIWSNN